MRYSFPLFELGEIVTSEAVTLNVEPKKIASILRDHVTGNFGMIDNHGIDDNREAIHFGGKIFSVHAAAGLKLHVITEADRACTTIAVVDE